MVSRSVNTLSGAFWQVLIIPVEIPGRPKLVLTNRFRVVGMFENLGGVLFVAPRLEKGDLPKLGAPLLLPFDSYGPVTRTKAVRFDAFVWQHQPISILFLVKMKLCSRMDGATRN